MAETQSLVPEWLSFNKELPASSQDKSHKPQFEREKHKRFGKQNSYHHLTHTPPSHPSALSSNWRNSDLNPRVLNRSKSSPVFDLKDPTAEPPKSPDRSNNSLPPQSSERSQFPPRSPKLKLKTRPPLMSSRSQPNLFTMDKMKDWQQQKLTTTRSPPSSRSSSFSSSGPAPLAPPQISVTPASAPQQFGISLSADDAVRSDSEIDKLRALVPAAAVAPLPKPPSRLANNNRKNTTHTKPQEKPKKPMLAFPAQLKKASSEPSLFAHGTADDFRRAKALKLEKELKLKETVENKDKTMAARNNFFMDVIKLEKQLQDMSEEELESAAANDEGKEDSVLSSSLELPVPLGQEEDGPGLGRISPTINREDEERFLREMGWVSEEEEHVPELDEKEIAEVKLKLRTQGGGSTPSSPLRNSYAAIRRVSLQSA